MTNSQAFDPERVSGPPASDGELLYRDLTHKIIGVAMRVHRELGPGLPEPLYQRAMKIELRRCDTRFESEKVIEVFYAGESIGSFRLDLLADDKVILELKAVEALLPLHRQQLLSYLEVSRLRVGLLINFGERSLKYERFVY
jgi:GxxExxY protein